METTKKHKGKMNEAVLFNSKGSATGYLRQAGREDDARGGVPRTQMPEGQEEQLSWGEVRYVLN